MQSDLEEVGQLEGVSLAGLPSAAAWVIQNTGSRRIILFEGGMGAGKTTFIKEICAALGVRENVSSPTFALVNEYEDGQGQPIYHFDFYRISEEREALALGALEYFDSGHLCLIEWPSKIEKLWPDQYVLVELEEKAGGKRTITLKRN